jgi:hypothetical protein
MSIVIVLLTLFTAAVHLSFFLSDPTGGVIYLLNALGYVTLVALLYLPVPALDRFRRPVRWALIAFTAVTIVAYIVFSVTHNEWTLPLGPVDKVVEVVLIGLLVRGERKKG